MMEFRCYASGSSGNLYELKTATTRILIECGVTFSKLNKMLNFRLHDIDACIISHAHGDHCKAHKDLAKFGKELYMTQETADLISPVEYRTNIIKPLKHFRIKDFEIIPFDTQHDIAGSVGFLIKDIITSQVMLYLTDSYYIKYKISGTKGFENLSIIAIECNYSEDLLIQNVKEGKINEYRAKRTLKSHMGLKHLKNLLAANDLRTVSAIYLIHLSNDNAFAEFIKEEIQKSTGKAVYLC